jgi:PAS domain S-box-containing protein
MNDEERQAYLAAIVESSDDAIISKNLNGVIQSFNAGAERLFGYAAAEIVGHSVTLLIPPERVAEEDEILSRLRRGERIEHFETVRVTKNGERLDVSLTISPVRDRRGRIIGASKIARDISGQKLAAARLAEQEELTRVTLNSIGDAVIACDVDARVTFINQEASRLTGWSMRDGAGVALHQVFRVVSETTRESVPLPPLQALHPRQMLTFTNHQILLSRSGVEWPISDTLSPIVDRNNRVVGTVVVFRDVTQAREDDARARAVTIEREGLLQSERLARGEAERANRVKDDFVAMVSHELRTPLNAILGWTDILKQNRSAAVLDHGLDVIARNTRLQAQLISDLLDVSRIVTGKLTLEFDHLDLANIVRNSVETQQSVAAERGVTIAMQLPPGAVRTLGDPARLQQIVWNLLSNALKFTPRGGRVTVALRASGDTAEISVSDTGIGIRSEFLPDLFERFRQATSTTTRRHGGLGLGLSIARHLAELHGGAIRAESAGENKGSAFTLELPIQTASAATVVVNRARETREAAALAERISFNGLRILVVEDDVDTRDVVRRLLEAHRADVSVAATALEALDRLELEKPQVLVSDIGLPDVDGYELVRRVRAQSGQQSKIPAVALTAFARPEDRTRALTAGYTAYIAKPVDAAELVITIGNLMNLVSSNPDR